MSVTCVTAVGRVPKVADVSSEWTLWESSASGSGSVKKRPKNKAIRMRASVKSTGGGGFTFADKVGGRFLAEMLRGGAPLGAAAGQIADLHFETRESGWLMDDQLIVLRNGGQDTRCAISVKSDTRLTQRGLDKEFVSDAWKHWDGVEGSSFDRKKDFLGLVSVSVSTAIGRDWDAVAGAAREGFADRVGKRLQGKGQVSAAKRRLFESLRKDGSGKKRDVVESVDLLAHLRLFHFDFESGQSRDEGEAIAACRELVSSGSLADGKKLWDRLVGLAGEGRSVGGYFDLPKLVRALRGVVELRDFRDFREDWRAIEERSESNIREIRVVVGDAVHLDRSEARQMVGEALQGNPCVAVVGNSGSGKSGIVADVIRTLGKFRRVVWLNAQQLSQPSQPDLSRYLGLRHGMETLVATSNCGGCLFVLDAFEQLRGQARDRALELAQIMTRAGAGQWKIIATVQPDGWLEMRRALLGKGVADAKRLDFANPDSKEILPPLASVPGVSRLFSRNELRPILCNLATLDWVIWAERKRAFESTKTWVGEAELIEWIWNQWVGDGADRHVLDSVLFHLGEVEGERISGAVPLNSLNGEQLHVVGQFEQKQVLRVTESAVRFSHELIGDWARLRSLVAAGDEAGGRIRNKAGIPRWSRAIRLYAQRLVERDEGLNSWKEFVAGLSGDSPEEKVASDLFLDGIIFAANADSLLERVWNDLIANKAEILRRLLQRIVRVATVPDVRFQAEMPAEDADLAAVWFRIPNPLYWMPMLRVLARHAEEVAGAGVFEAGTVCELWLRNIPYSFPGRREAGTVVLSLCRELQGRLAEGVMFTGDAGKVVFEALVYAAPEFPDDVSEISLQLCGRREEGENTKRRAQQAAEHRSREAGRRRSSSVFLPGSWGPIVFAGEDGPKRRVPGGFQTAVLETPALQSLASVRPDVAREVLLAVCLDEPKQESDYRRDVFSLPGFSYWENGAPPMYWKGGFLRFLETAPQEALAAILRLVNFATDRWLERVVGHVPAAEDRTCWSLEFEFRDATVQLAGDGNVFAWHRDPANIPDSLVCSLMALEKWLYDLVEKGELIDPWVEAIFEKSTSLAVAGVLVAVGIKNPKLFTGVLRPLLGNAFVYEIQAHMVIQESLGFWKTGMMLWARQGDKVMRIAYEWQRMPHRKVLLQDVAVQLFLFDEEIRRYLAGQREKWLKLFESAGEGRERFEAFLANFDFSNYAPTRLPDGQTQYEYTLPTPLETRAQEVRAKNGVRMFALQLPGIVRQGIAEGRGLKQESLECLVQNLQQVASAGDDSDPFMKKRNTEAVAAGIALLIILHRDWLSKNQAAEEWCFETLRGLIRGKPDDSYSPVDALDTATEGFVGQAGIALLGEIDDEWIKRAVIAGVTGHHYRATFHVLSSASRIRDRLGPEFTRLENAMLLWAVLRRAAERAMGASGEQGVLDRYRELILQRYLKGRVPRTRMPLVTANKIGLRLLRCLERSKPGYWGRGRETDGRQVYRLDSGLDLEVVRQGFGFLIEMTDLAAESGKEEVFSRGKELLKFELGLIPEIPAGDNDVDVRGTLYEFDMWVFERVVQIMLSGISTAAAGELWKPVLNLPVAAHELVRQFLVQWFRLGLASGVGTFESIWKEMVTHILDSPIWNPRTKYGWYYVHDIVAEMMGMRSAREALGQAMHGKLLESMAPLFERWAGKWVEHADLARSLAYFLSTEAGSVLLPMGLRKLAPRIESFSDYDWSREHLTDALSSAVRVCWKKYGAQLRSDRELWKAFVTILNALCARNDEMALAIRAEMTRENN